MIKFACGNCNYKLGAAEKYAGKRVRCPKCKSLTQVPQSAAKTGDEKVGVIKFRCPHCNQKIGVGIEHAGKRVRCAKCKNPLRVPEAAGRSTKTDETAVLKAGQEQRSGGEGFWGELENVDELLLAEAGAPAAQVETERSAADYGAGEGDLSAYPSEWPGVASLAETGARVGKSKKRRAPVLIVVGCVFAFLLAVVVGWYFFAGWGPHEPEQSAEFEKVKKFAEEYIYLLEDGKIERATELLSAGAQDDVEKDEIEELAKQIGKGKIVELECRLTHFEENLEGDQFFLRYRLRYEEDRQSVVVSVVETDEGLRIDGIGVTKRYGSTVSIGPRSYEELSQIVFAPVTKKMGSIFTKFFCGIMLVILVFGLLQIVSVWIVFEKAGEPGWAILIPGYNMWVLAEVGDKPGWLGLLMFFSGFVPYVGALVGLILSLVISIGVAKAFGRGAGFGVGLTLVPIVFYPILAFSSD